MSSPSYRMPPARPEELEETAELPMLPDSTPTSGSADDTHVMPALDALARTDTWQVSVEAMRAEPAAVASMAGDQVADKLRALTQSLRELEDHLHTKSEQLSVFEREVGARDQRIAALEQQLTQTHADLAVRETAHQSAQSETLLAHRRSERHNEIVQTLEVRRQLFETMVVEGEQQLAEAAARQHQLEQQLSGQVQVAAAREGELQSALAAERSRADTLQRQLTETQQNLATLQNQLQQSTAAAAHQQAEAATRQQQLEQQLSGQTKAAAVRDGELQSALAAEQGRTAELTAALAQARSELDGERARLASVAKQVAQGEIQLRDHLESIQALREQLEEAQSRGDTALADLAAAEERIRSAEHQVRQMELRLEKHVEAEAILRQQLLEIRGSLDERNSLIARLERETASSAAVIGSIQQNLSRIEAGIAPVADTASSVARLLVRTEGDTGIVHVLGRHTTIGRTPDNDVQIEADYISRHHAVMLLTADGTVVEDLDSTNGVYVNGKRVSRAALNEGDLLTIGRSAFRYVHKPAAERDS